MKGTLATIRRPRDVRATPSDGAVYLGGPPPPGAFTPITAIALGYASAGGREISSFDQSAPAPRCLTDAGPAPPFEYAVTSVRENDVEAAAPPHSSRA